MQPLKWLGSLPITTLLHFFLLFFDFPDHVASYWHDGILGRLGKNQHPKPKHIRNLGLAEPWPPVPPSQPLQRSAPNMLNHFFEPNLKHTVVTPWKANSLLCQLPTRWASWNSIHNHVIRRLLEPFASCLPSWETRQIRTDVFVMYIMYLLWSHMTHAASFLLFYVTTDKKLYTNMHTVY